MRTRIQIKLNAALLSGVPIRIYRTPDPAVDPTAKRRGTIKDKYTMEMMFAGEDQPTLKLAYDAQGNFGTITLEDAESTIPNLLVENNVGFLSVVAAVGEPVT